MLSIALLLLAQAVASVSSFEIYNNKPFVPVTIDGSAPQWFILDTGNSGPSIVSRDCADRLGLDRGKEQKVQIGAGAGADVGASQLRQTIRIVALGETLAIADPPVLALGHVARTEGHAVDGLIGHDFLSRHVVEIDYAKSTIAIHDPASYVPPSGATVVSLNLDTGWPIAEGTITPPGRDPIPCRLIIDTGVRFPIALFRPFSERHALHDSPGGLRDFVIGAGAGGFSRGDVGRLSTLSIGPASFAKPVAVYSRDIVGVFSMDGPDGIVGGELLRRHRVTFDYPHRRMILEPYEGSPPSFEFDMSGMFLTTDAPDYAKLRIVSVSPKTPAAKAGLRVDDEIVSIDGRAAAQLGIDRARSLLRTPGARQMEIRREGKLVKVRLEARRLI